MTANYSENKEHTHTDTNAYTHSTHTYTYIIIVFQLVISSFYEFWDWNQNAKCIDCYAQTLQWISSLFSTGLLRISVYEYIWQEIKSS